MKNLQFKTIDAFPLPGTEISEIKREASELSKYFKCRINFNHNGVDYVSDKDGNVAVTSNPYSDLGC